MKEYKYLFKNGDTCIKVAVKANDQDSAGSMITYLLNAPEKFDLTLVEVSERINPHPLRSKIFEASVVYVDGKTIKDRYKEEEITNYPIFEMFDLLQIESWDDEKKILKLTTKK
jgi:hypothetical protein